MKDLHSNRKGTQITSHLSRAGLELATLGIREKHLNLLSHGGVLFLINPGMLQPLHNIVFKKLFTYSLKSFTSTKIPVLTSEKMQKLRR